MIVCATIVREDKVLLVRHADARKPDYGEWLLPAWRVEPGESFEEALEHEIMEETSLSIKIVRKLTEHVDPYTKEKRQFPMHPIDPRCRNILGTE